MKSEKSTNISFGSALALLFTLANGQFGSREELFAKLFKSYHNRRTYELGNCLYFTSSSQITMLTKHSKPLPRKFYSYYTHDDGSLLREDLESFFSQAIRTARQETVYLNSLLRLIELSNNLLPQDKAYILTIQGASANSACEIWFRAFFVLIREPLISLNGD
jgi:hypothetical protein